MSLGLDLAIGAFVKAECDDYSPPLGMRLTTSGILVARNEPWIVDDVATLAQAHRLGLGELECLAYAIRDPSTIVCCDDYRARRLIASHIGDARVTGSIGLLKRCVDSGVLSVDEAFQCYDRMRENGAYVPNLERQYFSV